MNDELDAALHGAPWSLSGVVFGLGSLRDDEGRPVGERRAPAIVKEGVTMELRPCPYKDERQQRSINVSALEQIVRHFDFVLDDIARVRTMMGPHATSWEDVYVAMMAQLAQAAIHLLGRREAVGPIPTHMSVGYKVAAGYSIPLRELLELEARGLGKPVAVETLLGLVKERKLLVGAGEVCAGPPGLIARVTEALIHGRPESKGDVNPVRLTTARTLAVQVRVGIAWRLFDLAAERALLIDEIGTKGLTPRTKHLTRMIDERIGELDMLPRITGEIGLPETMPAEASSRLRSAMDTNPANETRSRTAGRIEELLDHGDGAIKIDASARPVFAQLFAGYLDAYRTFVHVLGDLERRHRHCLGFPADVPVKLGGAIFPVPKALCWFERIVGHRLRPSESDSEALELRNHDRTVAV